LTPYGINPSLFQNFRTPATAIFAKTALSLSIIGNFQTILMINMIGVGQIHLSFSKKQHPQAKLDKPVFK